MTSIDEAQTENVDYWIWEAQTAVNRLKRMTPTDEQLADACGDARRVERELGEVRRRWETLAAEMPPVEEHDKERRVDPAARAGRPVAVGQRYELVPSFTTNRTYNSPAIIAEVATLFEDEEAIWPAIRELIREQALVLTWKWTNLQRFFQNHGLRLYVKRDHEASDHDGTDQPMVGAVRKQTGMTRVPIKEEE